MSFVKYGTIIGFTQVTELPTTIGGYGITDAVPSGRTLTINGTTFDLSANRTFTVGSVTSVGLSSATSGVTIGSTPITTSGTITLTIATASGSQQGLLSSTDWTTFNNKQSTLSLSAIGSTPNANAATLTGAVLNLEPASASFGGVVTTGTQTFAGAKTFNSDITINTSIQQSLIFSNKWNIAHNNASLYLQFYNYTTGSIGFYIANSNNAATFSSTVSATSYYSNGKELITSDGTANYIKIPAALYFENASAATVATISNAGAATFSSSVGVGGSGAAYSLLESSSTTFNSTVSLLSLAIKDGTYNPRATISFKTQTGSAYSVVFDSAYTSGWAATNWVFQSGNVLFNNWYGNSGGDVVISTNTGGTANIILATGAGAGTPRLTIASGGAATFSSTLGINGVSDNIKSGLYTPTLTNISNVTTSSVNTDNFKYIRVGNIVHVSGWVGIQCITANTLTIVEITLPISSNLTSSEDVTGVSSALNQVGGRVRSNATTDKAEINVYGANNTTLFIYDLQFSYTIK